MEANEIMENEEIMETTEEIVKASSASGFKAAAVFGLVFIAGYVAGKYVIDPAIARIKARKQKKLEETFEEFDDDFVEEENEGEKKTE